MLTPHKWQRLQLRISRLISRINPLIVLQEAPPFGVLILGHRKKEDKVAEVSAAARKPKKIR